MRRILQGTCRQGPACGARHEAVNISVIKLIENSGAGRPQQHSQEQHRQLPGIGLMGHGGIARHRADGDEEAYTQLHQRDVASDMHVRSTTYSAPAPTEPVAPAVAPPPREANSILPARTMKIT